MSLDLIRHPHRRYNPLTGDWVLVSPQRTDRPWQGQIEEISQDSLREYDPDCYLCPGNGRARGIRNPHYTSTFVFDNDFPALQPDASREHWEESGLIVAKDESGFCRVICFSPRHDLALSRMNVSAIRPVVDAWVAQYKELGAISFINWVQIFENRGALMGASNPHPHCQVWANSSLPNEAVKENSKQYGYQQKRQSCLLCDYLALESKLQERVVCETDLFQAVVPFWAVWPFETLVLSKRHVTGLDELNEEERNQLADLLRQLTTRYDNLFYSAFPYTFGFHQRPTDGEPHQEWHLHAHFYPPLLRSATVRKFMVGYEMLASPQRDITAETAAARLRETSTVHYLDQTQPIGNRGL